MAYTEAAEAMEIAAELRGEGYSPSEALSEGWDIVRSNPVSNPGRAHKIGATLQLDTLTMLISAIGLGLLACFVFRYYKNRWPWDSASVGRPRLTGPVRRIPARVDWPRPASLGYHEMVVSPTMVPCQENVMLIKP